MVFLVLLQLLAGVLTFGDFSVPSPATTFSHTYIEAAFQVNGSDLIVYAKHNRFGFFGILYSNFMTKVHFMIDSGGLHYCRCSDNTESGYNGGGLCLAGRT